MNVERSASEKAAAKLASNSDLPSMPLRLRLTTNTIFVGRVALFSLLGFIIRTYKHDAYGS